MPVGFKATYNGRETEIDDLLIKREFFGDGGLYTWGNPQKGRLGNNTEVGAVTSPSSTAAGLGLNWKQATASVRNMAAIKSDGTLWTWGVNATGQLGTNNITSRSSPGTVAGGGTNWKQVSFGHDNYYSSFAAAVKTDGSLWTWGSCQYGQLGTGATTARSSPGTTAGGGNNWAQVACGYGSQFMAAVKTDGTLWTWGRNNSGNLGDGTITLRSSPGTTAGGGTNWKQVAVGNYCTAAVKTDGTLWTWGHNGGGQLGTNNTTSRSSPGTTVDGGTNWKQVNLYAQANGMAVKTDGTLWTWGANASGQLGDSTVTSRSSPGTTAGGGTNWKSTIEYSNSNANWMGAIKTDGTLWTWGSSFDGKAGHSGVNRSSPGTTDGGGTNWKQVCGAAEFGGGITDLTI